MLCRMLKRWRIHGPYTRNPISPKLRSGNWYESRPRKVSHRRYPEYPARPAKTVYKAMPGLVIISLVVGLYVQKQRTLLTPSPWLQTHKVDRKDPRYQ